MRDYAYEAALSFANRIRKEDGRKPLKRLPKGDQEDPCTCPLAVAANRRVFSSYRFKPADVLLDKDAPRDAQRFVRKFDKGGYPELIR